MGANDVDLNRETLETKKKKTEVVPSFATEEQIGGQSAGQTSAKGYNDDEGWGQVRRV